MSLRDYFAAAALQGWLASYAGGAYTPSPDTAAYQAYQMADAMLRHRMAKEFGDE